VGSYRVLEDLGHGRRRVRVTDGECAGVELVLLPRPTPGVQRLDEWLEGLPAQITSPNQRAERLLASLLTDEQRRDWELGCRFEVATAVGTFELGRLFDIGYRAPGGDEYRLCVVPDGYEQLPVADVWANLLLALRDDPLWFLAVANWRRPGGDWHRGPVPVGRALPGGPGGPGQLIAAGGDRVDEVAVGDDRPAPLEDRLDDAGGRLVGRGQHRGH
jgi:hypothetical protein